MHQTDQVIKSVVHQINNPEIIDPWNQLFIKAIIHQINKITIKSIIYQINNLSN